MIEEIRHQESLLAIIVSNKFQEPGIHFFTPSDLSQQLAYMHYSAGKRIPPHIHNHIVREVQLTQEVLVIKKGRVRVDFYTEKQKYLESRILESGDVIILIRGGHGFEILEEVEMIEVKQGPYLGEQDKTCFESVPSEHAEWVRK
jgi:mannose-6-phosphate isomerase-like protein (cupin superfamily)